MTAESSLVDKYLNTQSASAAIAVMDSATEVTYAVLAKSVERLTSALRDLGIGHGDRVAVYTPKCVGTVAVILSVLRTGACYIAISPSCPEVRRDFLLRDSAAKVLLIPSLSTQAESEIEFSVSFPPFGQMNSFSEAGIVASRTKLSARRKSGDAAYVLYTSGSTGRPKGVVMSHRGAAAFSTWAAKTVGLRSSDSVLNVTSFDFDLTIFDVFATQYVGARLVIADEHTPRSPRSVLNLIESQQITVLYTVPWTLIMILNSGEDLKQYCSSLRIVIFAGEVFPIDEVRRLILALPDVAFYNFYGPTETNACSYYRLPDSIPLTATEIPIGQPASGANLSIRDHKQKIVPDCAIGELFVEGPAVMIGYLEEGSIRPVVVPYATGDLALRRADGQILYRGRKDTQTKIRGHRINLIEVERVLGSHSSIRECAVCVVNGKLIAFVCLSASVPALTLRQHVALLLPSYMVPTEIHFVASLPRQDNLKVDRIGLERMLGT